MSPTATELVEVWNNPKASSVMVNQMEALSSDVDLGAAVLDTVRRGVRDLDVVDSIISGDVVRTIEGASTLTMTIHDAARKLLKSELLQDAEGALRAVDFELDGLWFRLVKVNKGSDDLTLTFEDREVAFMRRYFGPRKAIRGKITRAEFIWHLVKLVNRKLKGDAVIHFYSPELHRVQPVRGGIEGGTTVTKDNKAARDSNRRKGLTGSPGGINKRQRERIEVCLTQAERDKAGERPILGMLVAGFGESNWGENRGSRGTTFQTRLIPESQLATQAHHFLTGGRSFRAGGAIGYARSNPRASVGEIASKVEISDKGAGHYDAHRSKALDILDAWGGASGGITRTTYKKYAFKVARDETFWDAIIRLADEVKWRAFMVSGKLYFISEEELFRSRTRYRFSEESDGINNIDFDWDTGKRVMKATVSCNIDRWAAPPGSCVEIEDLGPATDKWLVETIRRDLYTSSAEITLKRPMRPAEEPAPEAVTGGSAGGVGGRGGSGEASGKWQWPARGPLTSGYGPRFGRLHDGIDISVPNGTRVEAADGGTVTRAGANGGYGNYIEITHNRGLSSFYGHLGDIKVKAGQKVSKGQLIATSNNTGSSTGPHLHFGVKPSRDPRELLP